MCRDKVAHVEKICEEIFDVYISSVEATHRIAMDDNVCQHVAILFADQVFEQMSTPLNQLLSVFISILNDCEGGKGKELEKGFLLRMEELKKTSATAALQYDAKGRLN